MTRRPSGEMATQLTYDEVTSTQKTVDAATHVVRVPLNQEVQRRHALAGRHVPHLDHSWVKDTPITRHDAPPVRKHGNTLDLRRRHIITKVQWTPQRTVFECPSSVATHLPVATSHTLSVLSRDPDTTRRPTGFTATPLTYEGDTSSQKYSGRRNARCPSALPASPHIRRSPRPTP